MVAFSIGNISVYRYGIFYFIGFIGAYFFLRFVAKKNFFSRFVSLQNLLKYHLDDLMIALVIGVLLGGRLGEVFIYQWHYFSQNLLDIFAVWNGGMSFIGGIVGVFIALLIILRVKKISQKEFLLLLDIILVIVPLGIFLGRFGNYLNQELYGLLVPADFWGMNSNLVSFFKGINIFHIYPNIDNNLRINTNFISMFFEGLVLLIILFSVFVKNIKKLTIKPGFITGLFLFFYSFFRFFIEYLRIDSQSQFLGFFTRSQWFFIVFIILSFWFLFNKKFDKQTL